MVLTPTSMLTLMLRQKLRALTCGRLAMVRDLATRMRAILALRWPRLQRQVTTCQRMALLTKHGKLQ